MISEPPIDNRLTFEKVKLAPWARIRFVTPDTESHFFGYYNYSPVSADGRRMLTHRVDFDGRGVGRSDVAKIGYVDLEDGSWHMLGSTRAFNWQQGAMLQWLGPDFQSRVIYNDQEEDRFVARIVDVATGRSRTVPHAVYAVHPSGRSALGVRFERHYFCRAYHYEGICDERWNVAVHPDDGIFAIDLEAGVARLIVRTSDIASLNPTPDMAGVAHWLEHLMWNPSGTRCGFLHRFGNSEKFGSRVLTVDPDGGRVFCLPGHADHIFSHMGWKDDRNFVNFSLQTKAVAQAYAATMLDRPSLLKTAVVWGWRMAKRIMPRKLIEQCRGGSGYRVIEDQRGVIGVLPPALLREDGHPSWTRDGRFMLTDTYADSSDYRSLLLYDAVADRLHLVGRFFSPFNACSYRCDLHPRFSRDEISFIIDTAHAGRHQMMVLDIDWASIR